MMDFFEYDAITNTHGQMTWYDTNIDGYYETIIYDAFGDGDLSSLYDWKSVDMDGNGVSETFLYNE
ncbi:hypothetical protein [Arthrobacter sp.]|uniref:hypothetical protein n=1 Tax=Arthrobacter sp. TaxID=1667 RepID=UPI0028121CAF|nr:hypothetical protein [Arthrobacter sp.]